MAIDRAESDDIAWTCDAAMIFGALNCDETNSPVKLWFTQLHRELQ